MDQGISPHLQLSAYQLLYAYRHARARKAIAIAAFVSAVIFLFFVFMVSKIFFGESTRSDVLFGVKAFFVFVIAIFFYQAAALIQVYRFARISGIEDLFSRLDTSEQYLNGDAIRFFDRHEAPTIASTIRDARPATRLETMTLCFPLVLMCLGLTFFTLAGPDSLFVLMLMSVSLCAIFFPLSQALGEGMRIHGMMHDVLTGIVSAEHIRANSEYQPWLNRDVLKAAPLDVDVVTSLIKRQQTVPMSQTL